MPSSSSYKAKMQTVSNTLSTASKKIVVAMSGGVDSAVAAHLLKEQGYEVIGVSLRLAPDDEKSLASRQGRCCSVDDMTDARQVCDLLEIPFYAVDARDTFKAVVFDPFVKAYREGRTPIPCLACNHEVKFGTLFRTAQSLGARLATGHYARLVNYKGQRTIARPKDDNRDQTYYLYGTAREVVESLEFPLADLEKPAVRDMARQIGMCVSNKPDSQEICFVPDGDHAKVVERASGPMPSGDLVHINGRPIGTHKGIHHFTIGQRRGIGVGTGERVYVVDVNASSNKVTLGPKDALMRSSLRAEKINCIVDTALWPDLVSVQIRARMQPALARWTLGENGHSIQVEFVEPVYAVAAGQAAVFYDSDVLLGGGIICP
jgi:tRNA-specific 2-thiouridylase